MTQVESFWAELRGWIGFIVAGAAIVIMALTERMRKVFPSSEMKAAEDKAAALLKATEDKIAADKQADTDRRLTILETQMKAIGKDIALAIQNAVAEMKESFTAQLNRFGERLEKDELTMTRIEKAVAELANSVAEINKHGSAPTEELKTMLHAIELTLNRQADQLEHLKTLGPCKHETK